MFVRDSMCPCIPNRVCDACTNVYLNVCVQHAENGAIHRIMGRQLFEKEGLYLHKRPWEERKPVERKTECESK